MAEQATTIVERQPGLVVVRVQPESIDERNLAAVTGEVAAAGAESPQLPVAVDLGRVSFMPSLSLAGLIQLAQLFRSRKQRLVLINLQPPVRETLLITKLDRVFEIQHDLAALLSRLG
jgi:anti-anti-sigma factor